MKVSPQERSHRSHGLVFCLVACNEEKKIMLEWFAWKDFGLETRRNCLEQGPG